MPRTQKCPKMVLSVSISISYDDTLLNKIPKKVLSQKIIVFIATTILFRSFDINYKQDLVMPIMTYSCKNNTQCYISQSSSRTQNVWTVGIYSPDICNKHQHFVSVKRMLMFREGEKVWNGQKLNPEDPCIQGWCQVHLS